MGKEGFSLGGNCLFASRGTHLYLYMKPQQFLPNNVTICDWSVSYSLLRIRTGLQPSPDKLRASGPTIPALADSGGARVPIAAILFQNHIVFKHSTGSPWPKSWIRPCPGCIPFTPTQCYSWNFFPTSCDNQSRSGIVVGVSKEPWQLIASLPTPPWQHQPRILRFTGHTNFWLCLFCGWVFSKIVPIQLQLDGLRCWCGWAFSDSLGPNIAGTNAFAPRETFCWKKANGALE